MLPNILFRILLVIAANSTPDSTLSEQLNYPLRNHPLRNLTKARKESFKADFSKMN
jgi:hypothetical protein